MTTDTGLGKKMVAFADARGYPQDHELRVRARDFEEATAMFFVAPPRCSVAHFMRCWTRARRSYIDHTGKSNILDP